MAAHRVSAGKVMLDMALSYNVPVVTPVRFWQCPHAESNGVYPLGAIIIYSFA